MIKKFFAIPLSLIILSGFISCKGLPVLKPGHPAGGVINPFLKDKYRLNYSIKAKLPNGYNALLIGVTVADPRDNSIHAIIMTIEGIVLLDVNCIKDTETVNRAVPPFDSSGFSRGLINDIRLVYFEPSCVNNAGTAEGIYIKRYKCSGGHTIDISGTESVKILKYEGGSLVRTADLFMNTEGIADKIEIKAPGLLGYSLYLELLEAEKL